MALILTNIFLWRRKCFYATIFAISGIYTPFNFCYAAPDGFYTVTGPDGLPINIPKKTVERRQNKEEVIENGTTLPNKLSLWSKLKPASRSLEQRVSKPSSVDALPTASSRFFIKETAKTLPTADGDIQQNSTKPHFAKRSLVSFIKIKAKPSSEQVKLQKVVGVSESTKRSNTIQAEEAVSLDKLPAKVVAVSQKNSLETDIKEESIKKKEVSIQPVVQMSSMEIKQEDVLKKSLVQGHSSSQEKSEYVDPMTTKTDEAASEPSIIRESDQYDFNQEKFYDSEALEKVEFNPEQKKRFYQIPLGAGQGMGGAVAQTVERVSGVNLKNLLPDTRIVTPQTLSVQPLTILPNDLVKLLNASGVDDASIRQFGLIKNLKTTPLSVWPKAGEQKRPYDEVIELGAPMSAITLQSFNATGKKNQYYWPLVIFFDAQHQVIGGGVPQVTQKKQSFSSQSGLAATILLPEKTHYVALMGINNLPDQQEFTPSKEGEMRIIPENTFSSVGLPR